jgi:eukaryotic translation initiation factor 2C
LLLKMNVKMGGTNHVLRSRAPATGVVFQSPPNSLSWIFDKPCMLVGIDVSHPEKGSTQPSLAAVVGTIDGTATKYVAHISAQAANTEMVSALTTAMTGLLTTFKQRNRGQFPETILVYRDGVSDGQYDQVLAAELPCIQEAVALMGYPAEAVKIAIVICTKGHRTRLFAQCGPAATSEYANPCAGLVVNNTITNPHLFEFFLNSHVAIQGTCKPCKYTLIYDEVGFKVSELELLTFWTTHLYSRCNRSVSYATPAYYAHWASKRGKEYMAAGATSQQLLDISAMCFREDSNYNMYFL